MFDIPAHPIFNPASARSEGASPRQQSGRTSMNEKPAVRIRFTLLWARPVSDHAQADALNIDKLDPSPELPSGYPAYGPDSTGPVRYGITA